MQFQSVGHVLGFTSNGMYVSNGMYSLSVKFVGANAIVPQAANSNLAADGTAPQLVQVNYPNLWPGVNLAYSADGGVARSTYTLATGAQSAAIRLHYNTPVIVEADGSLRLAYDTGEMRESAPLAWQEIEGVRVAVPITFKTVEARFERTSEVSFHVDNDSRYPLTITSTLTWNTFLGGSYYDAGNSIALDGSGNVYVAGNSNTTWGSPVRAYSGTDAFAAKLDSDGNLIWNTFLGGSSMDNGNSIAVDSSGNVYIAGDSWATWGSPVLAYTSGYDAFVTKLGSDGSLTWNTFLGGDSEDLGNGIAVDGSGSVYVTGYSRAAWGSPVHAFTNHIVDGRSDAFAAKLSASDGSLTWNTFFGGGGDDSGGVITADGSGNVYVVGTSSFGWGSPVREFTAWWNSTDAFVVKLGSDGSLVWNTFLGGGGGSSYDYSLGNDTGNSIVVDNNGNVYVTGNSNSLLWGNPVRMPSGSYDAFVVKLGNDGSPVWNTFLGGGGSDTGNSIAVDSSGNVYVAGKSSATWGSPVQAYSAGDDAFAAKLGSDGSLVWDTFLGGSGDDTSNSIAVDGSGNVFMAGSSDAPWNSPVRSHSGNFDAFVAKLNQGTPGYASSPAAGSSIDVGQGKVGSLVTAELTISETGNATLTVTVQSLSGTNAADFSVSPATLSIMDGGAAQQLSIHCTPSGPGLRMATLTVKHNAAGSPATYTLTCTGFYIVYLPSVTK